jgi:DNA-binding transcriptional LysR family regulator
MGTTLIKRRESNYDELELTEAGKLFYYTAKSILNLKEKLIGDIDIIKRREENLDKITVRIVTNAPIGIFALPKLIERFKKNFDQLDLKIIIETGDYSSMINLIKNKVCDIGIIPADLDVPCSSTISTFTQRISLVARNNFPISDINDFQTIPLVMLPNSFYTRRKIDKFFLQNNIKPNIAFELNYPFAIKELLKTENYAAILHNVIVSEEIRRGELVEIIPPFELPIITYKIIINQDSADNKYINEITNFLKNNL